MKSLSKLLAVALLLSLGGCAEKLVDLNVTIVDQTPHWKTKYIGSYEELGNDVLLLASVQAIDEEVKLKPAIEIPKGKLNALRVMQRQEFNQDGIQGFKNPQVAGEDNDGLLNFFETERTKTEAAFKEFSSAIIVEGNEDRIVATNENFTNRDLPKAQKSSTSLNHDNSKPDKKSSRKTATGPPTSQREAKYR